MSDAMIAAMVERLRETDPWRNWKSNASFERQCEALLPVVREQVERDAKVNQVTTCIALVMAAGGVVRVTPAVLHQLPHYGLQTTENKQTGEIVYAAVGK